MEQLDYREEPGPSFYSKNIKKIFSVILALALVPFLVFGLGPNKISDRGLRYLRIQDTSSIPTKVLGVVMDSLVGSPAVILYDEQAKILLPIWIGEGEALAIEMALKGLKPPRPLTNDLLKSIMGELGAKLVKTEITEVKNETFYANIFVLNASEKILVIDARPSDAIGLAIRFDAPIFVGKSVLKKYGISSDAEERKSKLKSRKT